MTMVRRIHPICLVLSITLVTQLANFSYAHHHKHRDGQACASGWSATTVHFVQTPLSTAANKTAPQPNAQMNQTTKSGPPPIDPSKQHTELIGIPFNYEGMPINATGGPVKTGVALQPVGDVKHDDHNGAPGTLIGIPCLDAGVLHSCVGCDTTLKGKDCYKKIGPSELDSLSAGDVECTKWYTRTAYGEGGGVTMCGAGSGDIYQCSGDDGMTQCQSCTQVGYVSNT